MDKSNTTTLRDEVQQLALIPIFDLLRWSTGFSLSSEFILRCCHQMHRSAKERNQEQAKACTPARKAVTKTAVEKTDADANPENQFGF